MPDYDTSSAMNGVSQGLDQFAKTMANGKIADSMARVNPELLQSLGMSKEQFGSLSAQDRTSAMSGAITGLTLQAKQREMEIQRQEMAARLQDFQAQADQRESVAKANAAVGPFVSDYTQGPPQPAQPAPTPGVPNPGGMFPGLPQGATGNPTPEQLQSLATQPRTPTPQERMAYAAKRNPAALSARDMPQILSNIESANSDDAGFQIQDIPGIAGAKAVTKKGSKEFQIMYGNGQVITPQDVTDVDGNPTGQKILPHPNGKGYTIIPQAKGKASNEMQPALDAVTKQPIPGFYVDSEGKTHDARTELEKVTGAKAGTAVPTEPEYKSPEDVKAAYTGGKLTKEQAVKVLKEKFPNFH